MSDNILVLGGGGREHALAWKLSQSKDVQHVYVSPGNGGTQGTLKMSNVAGLDIKDHQNICNWCSDNAISLVVIGSEVSIADGLSDSLKRHSILCFGPSMEAGEIEWSKNYAKEFMQRWNIPTARYKAFTQSGPAHAFINNAPFPALVIKASGLAAGKGVIIAENKSSACQAVTDILENALFGSAGNTVIIEEKLEGEEISCLAFTDGESILMMPPAQDHKRLGDGDKGPNTGGMGAYCPCNLVTSSDLEMIRSDVLQKAVDGMRAEGRPYQGVLYAGLMLTEDGPKVLEFNCRFGDPETQVLLPMMCSDLYEIISACINNKLSTKKISFYDNQCAVAVVTVAKGYPSKYNKGMPITGIEHVDTDLNLLVFHAGTYFNEEQQLLTNGGRVLTVVAIDQSVTRAAKCALEGADKIKYEDKVYRKDIASRALNVPLTYSDSGVSISNGEALVDNIKSIVKATLRSGCVEDMGMFGAAFDLQKVGYIDPLLISGTDGVGTKLEIAQLCNQHKTIGFDLVAMCVNDILCHGAEPLFFLDYFACSKLEVGVASEVITSISLGCQQAGCALIGGETAEMPGMYGLGKYDMAGFTVGVVERMHYLPQLNTIQPGDHVIGLASTGSHSNGYSLIRKVVEMAGLAYSDRCPFDSNRTLGEALLIPTQIYVKPVLASIKCWKVKAIAHITGGGLPGNVCRILPDGVGVQLDANRWSMPDVFRWISQQGNVDPDEMAHTFNCGIGLVLIVDKQVNPQHICDTLKASCCSTWHIGSTTTQLDGQKRVSISYLDVALKEHYKNNNTNSSQHSTTNELHALNHVAKKRVAVFISGSGTNMKALIDHSQDAANNASYEISLVISNKPNVGGLSLAQQCGIQTKVIKHKDHSSREAFDAALHTELQQHNIDIVCLAGFMRILTAQFVGKWEGRMLNIHPSLLPSFKGGNAHEQVLASKVCISGCTVHFVAEEVDGGAILAQESVPVYPDDTLDKLSSRVKLQEHRIFPGALELLASGKATLGTDGHILWK